MRLGQAGHAGIVAGDVDDGAFVLGAAAGQQKGVEALRGAVDYRGQRMRASPSESGIAHFPEQDAVDVRGDRLAAGEPVGEDGFGVIHHALKLVHLRLA